VRGKTFTIAVVALASVALAGALVQRPGDRGLALDAFLLLLGSIALLLLVRATARAFPAAGPSELERALGATRPAPARVPELERLQRELAMSVQSAFDSYHRLRPALREVATDRLGRYGVELDGPGRRAEELLGEAAWGILRPGLERPRDHMAPGVPLPTIEAAVTALERL
jgi:hypothetical protein